MRRNDLFEEPVATILCGLTLRFSCAGAFEAGSQQKSRWHPNDVCCYHCLDWHYFWVRPEENMTNIVASLAPLNGVSYAGKWMICKKLEEKTNAWLVSGELLCMALENIWMCDPFCLFYLFAGNAISRTCSDGFFKLPNTKQSKKKNHLKRSEALFFVCRCPVD